MADMMKAQVFYEPSRMELAERPIPKISDTEVLVRVKVCGICGSDIAYYYGAATLETPSGKGPLVLGHEFTGEVVEVGRVPGALGLFKPGDRVVLDPVQYCNACEICAKGQVNLCETKTVLGVSVDGGFAEYAKSKYTGVKKLPDNVSYEQGSLTEPLACATYALQKLEVAPGDFCVVIGPGPIGLMMVQLAKSSGAGTVVLAGTRDYRLEVGKKLGADVLVNTKDKKSPHYVESLRDCIAELTKGKMADRVVTPTGAVDAMETALDISGRRSIIVFFGLPGPADRVRVPALQSILWDKTIRFSWLAPFTWPQALSALSSGLVKTDELISHRFSLRDLPSALGKVRDREDRVMKAVVMV